MKDQSCPILKVEEIIKATEGTLVRGNIGNIFNGLSTDSRRINDGNLFLPLIGERFNGHDFIAKALIEGASGTLVQKGNEAQIPFIGNDVSVIVVRNTLKALGDIAHFWRKKFSIPIVAVTGSSGKTTTKEMIACIASLDKKIFKSKGNYNNLIGLPLTLLEMTSEHQTGILEMGSNKCGEILRLSKIAMPDIGIITNIGPAHLAGFESLQNVREEKGSLWASMRNNSIAVINKDDEAIRILSKRWDGKGITFGLDESAFVTARNIRTTGIHGVVFTLQIGDIHEDISLSIAGKHNIYNALAAAASAWSLGIEFELICEGLSSFKQILGRMNIHKLKNGINMIDDTYNANPASVNEALKTLYNLRSGRKCTVIFGDMLELGSEAAIMHEEIGEFMASTGVSQLFLKGIFSRSVAEGAKRGGLKSKHIFFLDSPDEIIANLSLSMREGDWILVKGSRRMKMENISNRIIETFGSKEI